MVRLLVIGLGGALGTLARYAVGLWCQRRMGSAFPYGTLAVNVVGSLLLGVVMQLGATTDLLSPTARLALGTGVMGGFTTYSTFNYETLKLLQDRAWLTAGLNMLATTAGSSRSRRYRCCDTARSDRRRAATAEPLVGRTAAEAGSRDSDRTTVGC